MKKIIAFLLATLIVGSMTACGNTKPVDGTADSKTSNSAEEKKEITVAGVVFQEDQFMKLVQMGYQAAAKDLGAKCMISNTNNDQAKEAELINTYVSQKIDGIAITPLNNQASMQALKAANEKGLEIAIANTSLKDGPFVCGGFTSDNYMLGKQTGELARKFIKEKLDGKAKVAILQFKSQLPSLSAERANGFLDQIKDLSGVEVVADQDAWMQDQAVQVAGDILTANNSKGGVDIIWAANDGGTIGATMAVKNAGKAGETFVFGTDAAEQQVAMIKSTDNILQCVTGQDPYQIGYNSMEVLIKSIKGEKGEYGKVTIVPGIVLSRTDIEAVDEFAVDLAKKTK